MIAKHADRNLVKLSAVEMDKLDTLTFEAMNTSFYFAVIECSIPNWKEVIQGWVQYVDKEWSRFVDDNELDFINRLEIGGKSSVTPPLLYVLLRAEEYRMRTNGLFSPYLLPQLEFHGYQHSFPFHSSSPIFPVMPPVYKNDSAPFIFDINFGIVERRANGQIDLGGIGKGYAVQAAARWLKMAGETKAGIVDGGGDITVWSNGEKDWKIGVAHPYEKEKEIAHFWIKNGSIATSNIVYRSWKQGNEQKHHLLNGKTGLPAVSDLIQATVITENCLDAEVMAKLCFMEKEDSLRKLLNGINPVYSLLLVKADGKIIRGLEEEMNA